MSSKPFFSLATYLASRTSEISGPYLSHMPARPDGTVIWVWATHPDQIATLRGLESLLSADGDKVSFVISLPEVPDAQSTDVMQAPANRPQTQTFLTHWLPNIVVWMRGDLEPSVLLEITNRDIPCILLEAGKEALHPAHGSWVPGLTRALIQQFTQILTIDDEVGKTLIKAGATPDMLKTVGQMETAPPALPHFEDERQEMAQALGSRPVWLAADSSLAEVDILADAHHHASLRSHRLMLIVTVRDEDEGPAIAQRLRDRGYLVALVTYLGHSLVGGGCRNPFEAATLGSAIIHGPHIAPYQGQVRRLQQADACVALRTPGELGPEVERLLAPDTAALLVHGGWEVTSRGAESTGRVAEILMDHIDKIGG